MPSAEARLWQAEDSRLALILASYVDEPVKFTWTLDPAKFGLASGRYRLSELKPEGPSPLGAAAGAIRRTEDLGPAAIKVVEIEESR